MRGPVMRRAVALTVLAAGAAGCLSAAEKIVWDVVPDRYDALYAAGDTASVRFLAKGTNGLPLAHGTYNLRVDNFGARTVTNVTVDLARENPFTCRVTRATPGFLRFTASGMTYGIGFSPERIRPGTPCPDDFEAFWRQAIAQYDRTIPDAPEERADAALSDKTWLVSRLTLAAPGGRKVYGFVTRERAAKGRLPGRVQIAAAGYGSWSQCPVRLPGHVTLFLTVYPFEPDVKLGRKADYDAGDAAAKARWGVARYALGGISESREAYFFYPVILAANRAIDWFAARADVDPLKISYSGTSQGGGLGLAVMGLNRHFANGCVFVPALTDLMSSEVEERQSGWPRLVEGQTAAGKANARRFAPYFCGANFARLIRAPIRFCVGYADTTCAPHAVYGAFNVCPSADKEIGGGIGMGHGVFGDCYAYFDAWSRAKLQPRAAYRFLAFNIWGDYFGNPVAERKDGIAATIRAWAPDVAGFQETTENFWKSDLMTQLAADYAVLGRGLGPKGANAHTPLLYRKSRFACVDSGALWFCEELDSSKGAVWAVLREKSTGRHIAAFASHYWWRADGRGDDWIRLHGSKLLLAKMRELAKKYDAAIIGGGDLNSPVTSDALRYLVAHGLNDAQATAPISPCGFATEHGDPVRYRGGAYAGRNGVRGHCRVPEKFRHLDHIFYDPQRIAMRRFDLDISARACRLSDHHPIVADFDLVGAQ